jgi:hypothetical protein
MRVDALCGYPPDATGATLLGEAALIRKGTKSKRMVVAHSKTPRKLSNRAAAEMSVAVPNMPTE